MKPGSASVNTANDKVELVLAGDGKRLAVLLSPVEARRFAAAMIDAADFADAASPHFDGRSPSAAARKGH